MQYIINGIITGILYSLCAIGFALVYNTTRIFHIAAAAIYVIAAYALYYGFNVLGLPIAIALILSLGITSLFSLGIERFVYRPLYNKRSSLNVMMISSIGVMTVLVNVIAMVFGSESKIIINYIQKTYVFESFQITTPQMIQLIIGSMAIVGFLAFLNFTRFGLEARALSSNDKLFKTLGYSVKRTRTKVFLLSGTFLALASCITVYDIGLDPNMGMTILINAMVAMILGGIGRFDACILGGITLGLIQAFVVATWGSSWQNAITFLILIVFLFKCPQGLMGYKKRTV